MNNFTNKKEEELVVGRYFIEKINYQHSFDYRPEVNLNEDDDVDVYGRSEFFNELRLQVTVCDGKLKKVHNDLLKEIQRGGRSARAKSPVDIEYIEQVRQVIQRKVNKSYSNPESLILLVGSSFGLINEEHTRAELEEFSNSRFKGIYLVVLPVSSKISSHPHDGKVIAIKEAVLK